MVGVAGRSKACVTCKQRKIRCSLEQPECKVCAKSSRQCGGYHWQRVFVLDARTAKDTQHSTIITQSDTDPTPEVNFESQKRQFVLKSPGKIVFDDSPFPFNFWRVTAPVKQLDPTKGSILTNKAFSSLWSISCPSTRSCYRQQILSEFLYTYYKDVPNPAKAERVSGGWLTMLPDLPNFTTALEASILAVCTARLGRVNGDKALVRESLKFYTQALRELQKALWSPNLMYREETVAACMALLMYEVGECPDKNTAGWIGHMRGCAKLVELRGPKGYESEFSHRLFVTFRQIEVQQAIVERRSTFLANPAWIDRPWKGYTKSIDQDLLDLMAEMANIGEAGYYPANPENPVLLAAELMQVVHRCWALDAKLQVFYTRLEQASSGPLYWPVMAEYNPLEETQAFPVTYEFSNLSTVHTCTLYWATCSILWSGLIKIYEILGHLDFLMKALAKGGPTLPASTHIHAFNLTPSPTPSDTTVTVAGTSSATLTPSSCEVETPTEFTFPPAFVLPPLEHRTEIPAMATNICQALPYYEAGLASVGSPITVVVFPLKTAIEGFSGVPGYEKELAWALGNFQLLIGSGAQLLEHLGREVTEKTHLPS